MKQLEHNNNCTYWSSNSAFEPKRLLLYRLFFINEERTEYVSVCFYPARDYKPLVEFGVVRTGGAHKNIILNDEHVDALAVGLSRLRDAMCFGDPAGGSECKSCPSD